MRNGNLLKSDLWNLRKRICIPQGVGVFVILSIFSVLPQVLSIGIFVSAWLKYESTESVKFYKNRSCVKFLAKCIWLAAILLMGQNPTLFTSGYFCHHYCIIVEATLFVWDKYTNVNRDVQFEELVWKINYAPISL